MAPGHRTLLKALALLAVPVALGAYSVMPAKTSRVPFERVQDEPAGSTEPAVVTDEELQVYIEVYKAMQIDHSLTVDSAVVSHGLTVEQFRDIERRVQDKPRLVAKVREALVEQARQRSAFSEPRPAAPRKSGPLKAN